MSSNLSLQGAWSLVEQTVYGMDAVLEPTWKYLRRA